MKKIIGIFLAFLISCSICFATAYPHWEFTKKIKVYIQPHKDSHYMQQAFNTWSKKTNNKIIFYYVQRPNISDIEVYFVDNLSHTKHDKAIGLTTKTLLGNKITHAKIQIAAKSQDGKVLGVDCIYTVMLHEIGHALGLDHTDDKASIMYPTEDDRSEILTSDLKHLYRIYGW